MDTPPNAPNLWDNRPRFTGRKLVMLNRNLSPKTIVTKAKDAAIKLACFKDFKEDVQQYHKAFEEGDGIIFENCSVAIINKGKEEQISTLCGSAGSKNAFIYIEPEKYVYAFSDSTKEFLRGYKAAVDNIYRHIGSENTRLREEENDFHDDEKASWGIHATDVLNTKWTGKGVNVAILDTGFNLSHPDFAHRNITSKSFVKEEKVADGNGHGTHCTGISTGNINKETGRRYGVAKEANIFAGKVLNNAGSGTDSGILAGIEWAIMQQCDVISMSLGAPVQKGETYSSIYNDLAKKALKNGTLIIAAAGNASRRDLGMIAPVGHPANCPAIMAVAALDNKLAVAYFSNGSINPDGGQIDIAAPGVDIYSSWKAPENYNVISGTSMATPFVSGMAALCREAYPEATAQEIWTYLTQNAKRLEQPASDVGAGITHPPKQIND